MRLHVAASLYQKIKNCLQTLRFCLALPLGPTPSPSDLFGHTARMVFACGSCGQCGQSVGSRKATALCLHLVGQHLVGQLECGQCGQSFFFCPLCPPFRLFLFAWEFPAWTFVDNVDKWTIDLKSLDPPLPIF